MKNISRRVAALGAFSVLATVAVALAGGDAFAQERYPSRPVNVIVPGTVGGGADIVARLIATKLGEALGQPVVVETIPGASGAIGTLKVTKAKPDGHTLLFAFNQLVTMNPNVIPNLSYNVEKELVPVARLVEGAYVWIANNGLPAKNIPELIAAVKAQPGRISVAVNGMGSAARLGSEMLAQIAGAELLIVNYSGNATPDLLAGVIQLKMEPSSVAVGLVKGGQVKALGVTGRTRMESLPDVPTVGEALPGYAIQVWYAVFAPYGTPRPIVDRLNAELVKVMRNPEVVARMNQMEMKVVAGTAEELNTTTRSESSMWAQLVKTRRIRIQD